VTNQRMVSSQENQAEQPAEGQETRLSAGIPVDDPQAALRFCRWLAESLAGANGYSPDRHGSGLSHPGNGVQVDQPGASARPVLSVVIPVCEEEGNLPILYERLTSVLEENEPSYEILFIDDGSRDGSVPVLQHLVEQDQRVTIVELARNFGHQVAISAGLDFAQGNAVIIMDADLQDPPEVLPRFIEKWREGHEVVYAIRAHRQESPLKRLAYATFYRILQRIANIEIPLDAGDFCIMDRRVVDILVNMPERNRFVRGIRSWVGLDQVGLVYERHARYSGKPKLTFSRLVYLALDGLISFSYIPLRTISMLGFAVSIVSILMAMVYIIQKLTVGLGPSGFATLIVAILFLAGMQLITMGVIGEYVGRIFEEVKRRPLYVVRRVVKRQH
jgi:glycosyltransferase involved in cell wall biosynthesis